MSMWCNSTTSLCEVRVGSMSFDCNGADCTAANGRARSVCAGGAPDSGLGPMDTGTVTPPPVTPPPPPPETLPRYEGLSLDCWLPPNSYCNPANNEGCAAGEACDVASDERGRAIVACFPPPAEQQLGEACNNESGPFCAGGLRCMVDRCMDTCCTDSECAVGERCAPLDASLGSLGVCSSAPVTPPPTCSPPGGFCAGNGDCCSNDCHFDHCH
ncbi:MAG: hypothetical protein AAF411_17995 [Myxococcota bacterium]